MRAFLAASFSPPLEASVRQALDALKGRAGGGYQWADPAEVHLTLRFLGEVPDEAAAPMAEAVAKAVRGLKPFPLKTTGYGGFPYPDRVRIAWIGMEPFAPLLALRDRLDAALEPFDIRWEEKPFVPHLTLGRHPGGGADLSQAFLDAGAPPAGEHLLTGVVLFRSAAHLRGPGAVRHTRLAEAPLAG